MTIPLSDDTRVFTSVKRSTAVDAVHDRLLTAIAVGAYSPGDALPSERDLAPMLEVSRATLRQAIERLVEQGLLESRRGRGGGTFVTERSWREVETEAVRRTLHEQLPALAEVFDERCLVEGMIAGAAAERRTPEQAERLLALVAEFEGAGEDMPAARLLDERLHHLVVECAGNARLERAQPGAHGRGHAGLRQRALHPGVLRPGRTRAPRPGRGGRRRRRRRRPRRWPATHFRITALTMEAVLGD